MLRKFPSSQGALIDRIDGTPAHLFVCSALVREVRAALSGDPQLGEVQVHSFPARCGAPQVTEDELQQRLNAVPADAPAAWIGSACIAGLCAQRSRSDADGPPTAQGRPIHMDCLQQCFYLVADSEMVDAELRRGQYLCTPSWLAHWPERLRALGLDSQPLARALFKDSVRGLLLLDTGDDPEAAERLAALGAYLDQPYATKPVGLGTLRANLRLAVLRARLVALTDRIDRERGALQSQLADAALAMDLLAQLADAVDRRDAIQRMLEIFSALFAPRLLFYLPVETVQSVQGCVGEPIIAATGEPPPDPAVEEAARFVDATSAYADAASGRGFLLRLGHQGGNRGVLMVDELSLPDELRRYANLALQIVGLCALALERAEAVSALSASEQRYRKLFETMQEGFAVLEVVADGDDADGPNYRFSEVNPAFAKLLGERRGALLGHGRRVAAALLAELGGTRLMEVLRGGQSAHYEIHAPGLGKDLDVYAYRPTPDCVALLVDDISARRRAEAHVRHLAHHDPLTDLPNRSLLAERTRDAILDGSARGEPLALFYCDLDHFKDINDSFGHAAGDRLLRVMSGRLRMQVRETDTVARQGGDELVLLLPGADHRAAAKRAETLLEAIACPVEVAGRQLRVTASIGVALYPRDGEDFDTLAQAADTALYRAKQDGRNRVRFYDSSMNTEALRRVTLLAELGQAMVRNELRIWYQPKVALADGTVIGYEALLRWQHPEQGLLLPGRFIGMAEQTDLIIELGNWVLAEVCRQQAAWRDAGAAPLTVAVNIGARHFGRSELVAQVERLLGLYDLSPGLLLLELTESTLLDGGEKALANIDALRTLGVRLAIDDFGTGYSNLKYLKDLPIVEMKIDAGFVRDLERDDADRAIVGAVVAIGRHLDLRIIAEGVETERQRDILQGLGCGHGQGWLFGRPTPAGAIQSAGAGLAWEGEKAD